MSAGNLLVSSAAMDSLRRRHFYRVMEVLGDSSKPSLDLPQCDGWTDRQTHITAVCTMYQRVNNIINTNSVHISHINNSFTVTIQVIRVSQQPDTLG